MKQETWLPIFPGFYNTIFEPDEEPEMNYWNTERAKKGLTELSFDEFEFDYSGYQNDVCEGCVNFIESELRNYVTAIHFQSLSSPKEYNFYTDSINIEVELSKDNTKTIKQFLSDHLEDFEKYIHDRYTSRDGFISHYNNDSNEWLAEIDDCLSHSHKLGSILQFILLNESNDNLMEDMYYSIEANLSITNYNEVSELEYCPECKSWVKPENFNGNCCMDCNDFSIQNFDKVVCTHCKELIVSAHEKRHFVYQLKHGILKPSEVLCSDCQIN